MTHLRGCFLSHNPRAVRSFESKENEKQKQSQGRDHLIIKDLFVGSNRKRGLQSESCYAFNETGNTFLPTSFLHSFPVSSLHCKAPRSGHSRGREAISHWKGMVMVWKPFSRGRRGVFCGTWPYSLTCCGL